VDVELGESVLEMLPDGVRRDEEQRRDLLVDEPAGVGNPELIQD
jgi:hypothetical protein